MVASGRPRLKQVGKKHTIKICVQRGLSPSRLKPFRQSEGLKTLPILGLKPGLNPVLLPQAKAMGLPLVHKERREITEFFLFTPGLED